MATARNTYEHNALTLNKLQRAVFMPCANQVFFIFFSYIYSKTLLIRQSFGLKKIGVYTTLASLPRRDIL